MPPRGAGRAEGAFSVTGCSLGTRSIFPFSHVIPSAYVATRLVRLYGNRTCLVHMPQRLQLPRLAMPQMQQEQEQPHQIDLR